MQMTTPDKVLDLERRIQQLERHLSQLTNRVNFLERENQRRRSDVNQLAQQLAHRKG